jgi:hypothetical protein
MSEVGKIEFGPNLLDQVAWAVEAELKKPHHSHFTNIDNRKEANSEKCSSHQFVKASLSAGGHPMFNQLLSEMSHLHATKNKDYAGNDYFSNFKMCEDIGIPAWKGVFVRLSDKYSRIKNIIANGGNAHVATESLEDSLMDLSVYSLIILILLRETKNGTPIATEEDR